MHYGEYSNITVDLLRGNIQSLQVSDDVIGGSIFLFVPGPLKLSAYFPCPV